MTEHGGFGGATSAPVSAQVAHVWMDEIRGTGRFANYPELPRVKKLGDLKKAREEQDEHLQ